MSATIPHPQTTIEVPADLPLVRIVREFDAPPSRVFRAHVDPDLLARWLGPRDLEMTVEVFDARDGGEYHYTHRRGTEAHAFRGCFHTVRPDELIIQTFSYLGAPDEVVLERLDLVELGDGRTRLTVQSTCGSLEGRDAMVASGMEVGVVEGYEKLDDLLAG